MDLLVAVRNSFTPAALQRAAAHFGEAEGGVSRAIDQAIPTVAAGVLQSIADPASAGRILRLIADSHHHGRVLSDMPAILSSRNAAAAILTIGDRTAGVLFGGLLGPLAQAIAEESEVSKDCAADVLRLTCLVSFEVIAREAAAAQLTREAAIEALSKQRRVVARALPPEVAKLIHLYDSPGVPDQPIALRAEKRKPRLLPFKLFA